MYTFLLPDCSTWNKTTSETKANTHRFRGLKQVIHIGQLLWCFVLAFFKFLGQGLCVQEFRYSWAVSFPHSGKRDLYKGYLSFRETLASSSSSSLTRSQSLFPCVRCLFNLSVARFSKITLSSPFDLKRSFSLKWSKAFETLFRFYLRSARVSFIFFWS